MSMKASGIITGIIAFLIFALAFSAIGFSIYTGIKNEENRIAEGIIVDKEIAEGYTHATHSKESGRLVSYPTTYHFLLQGEKNGEVVEYWTTVTADEYNSFRIGDYYRK